MAEQNIALNKLTSASSYVKPYESARAVNGTYGTANPTSRWLCNTLPGWLMVDLGMNGSNSYWVNRWVVRHMSCAGWQSLTYNMSDFKLQGSNNNSTWYDIDSVVGNTIGVTDRTLVQAVAYKYVRLYVTKGLLCNPRMASAMEFEVYQSPPLSAYLQTSTGLTVSSGALSPAFANNVFNYTTPNVANTVTYVEVRPTAEDSRATIKVNGVVVTSGNSTNVALNVGSNAISVVVTAADGRTTKTYTVTVVRAAALTGLSANIVGGVVISLTPSTSPFDGDKLSYSGTIEYSNANFGVQDVAITPTADVGVLIKYNGSVINSGTAVTITPNVGDTTVKFDVSATDGSGVVTYEVKITRKNSTCLGLNGIKTSKGTVAPSPLTKVSPFTYSVKTGISTTATLTFTAEDPSSTITLTLDSATTNAVGTISINVTQISSTVKTATVIVSSSYGISPTTYTVNVSK